MIEFLVVVVFFIAFFSPEEIGRIGAKIVQGYEEAREAALDKGF